MIESATARSSPKLGRVTRMPSILALFSRNSLAHTAASFQVEITPWEVSFSVTATTSMPASFSFASICLAALLGQFDRENVAVSHDKAQSCLFHSEFLW